MDVTSFIAEKTNTNENMWIIQKEFNIENGKECHLSCSTGKEAVLKLMNDNTYELTTFGEVRK
jgi:hypothetical protein